MQNAAAHTNREKNDPEADYQQQILTASNYLSKGKHEQANAVLERAIVIAQKQGLHEAVVAARIMLAQSLAVKAKGRSTATIRTGFGPRWRKFAVKCTYPHELW